MEDNQKIYSASSIKVMEGLEAVRKRPGMYIGTTDKKGLHHLVYEVMDNSVDEALGGHCDTIKIILHKDGSCSVEDNGRGIPTGIHPTEGISAAEVVMTKLHAGGKFDKESYIFSGGLHGVGVSVVNALSKWLKLTIFQDGKVHEQLYEKGKPINSLTLTGETEKRGTLIRFFPDSEIFKETLDFDFEFLSKRFQELAYLNKGLSISIADEITGEENSYCYNEGIISYLNFLNKDKEVIFPEIIFLSVKEDKFELEIALQYNSGYDEKLFSFVNNINTYEGGTHVSGFKSALTSACNKKAKDFKLLEKDQTFSSEDVREGMVCILNVKIAEPQFEGQTKAKLGNLEVKGMIHSAAFSFFETYFEEQPSIIKKILGKAEMALRAREAAKRAREITRKKGVLESTILPGKLSDCSSEDPSKNEIFIVEGDSAGGSAKTGRDRFNQAILPLRGKILNVEKASLDKILANEEIKALVAAIGIGLGNDELDIKACRYHKIIIMTDADVDGSHIRTLLLTFFYRYLKSIITTGYLYIAQPPLYKAKIGKHDKYLQNDFELMNLVFSWAKDEIELIIDGSLIQKSEAKDIFEFAEKACVFFREKSKVYGIEIHEFEKKILNGSFSNNLTEDLLINIKRWNSIIIMHRKKQTSEIMHFSYLDFFEVLKLSAKPFMHIQRYKGLGEMNADQLWDTAMNPANRQLLKVTLLEAEKADLWFDLLMGDDAAPRKTFIEERAHFVKNLDL